MSKKVPMSDVFDSIDDAPIKNPIISKKSSTKSTVKQKSADSISEAKITKNSTQKQTRPRPKVKKASITKDRPGFHGPQDFPFTFDLPKELKPAFDLYTETFGMTPQETITQGVKVVIKLGPLGGLKPFRGFVKHVTDKSPLAALMRDNLIEAAKLIQQRSSQRG